MTKAEIESLKQKRDRINKQIKLAEAKAREQNRKDDTRRKIINGALVGKHEEKNPGSDLAKIMERLRNEYVTKPSERKLMGLPPLTNDNLKTEFVKNGEKNNG